MKAAWIGGIAGLAIGFTAVLVTQRGAGNTAPARPPTASN